MRWFTQNDHNRIN